MSNQATSVQLMSELAGIVSCNLINLTTNLCASAYPSTAGRGVDRTRDLRRLKRYFNLRVDFL